MARKTSHHHARTHPKRGETPRGTEPKPESQQEREQERKQEPRQPARRVATSRRAVTDRSRARRELSQNFLSAAAARRFV
ncbi:MAG: hypothetical protein HOV68_23590, partial [Streptomycetaceae bacterium]|nr:hypothetical protein [Streptomycetaceae bacterium]